MCGEGSKWPRGKLGHADDVAGARCGGRVTGRAASWADGGGKRKGGGGTSWAASSMPRPGRGGRKRGRDWAGSRGWAENEE